MENPTAALSCPACARAGGAEFVEPWRDPVAGGAYRIYRCPGCGVSFAEPRDPVGPDWYARARSLETAAHAADWRYSRFFAEVRPPARLLDVGCGAGAFLRLARDRGFAVTGIDFNPTYVDAARAAGLPDVRAVDFERFFAERPEGFDAVTLFDVLEHVPEPAGFLRRLKGALRPGGVLALSVPNAARPLLGPASREQFDYPPYHFTRWTPEALRALLEREGFAIETLAASPLPFGYFSGLLYYRLLNAVFPALKRLLFGSGGAAARTWTDLLDAAPGTAPRRGLKAWLADPGRRERLIAAGGMLFAVLFCVVETPVVLGFRRLRPRRGRTLYAMARA